MAQKKSGEKGGGVGELLGTVVKALPLLLAALEKGGPAKAKKSGKRGKYLVGEKGAELYVPGAKTAAGARKKVNRAKQAKKKKVGGRHGR